MSRKEIQPLPSLVATGEGQGMGAFFRKTGANDGCLCNPQFNPDDSRNVRTAGLAEHYSK